METVSRSARQPARSPFATHRIRVDLCSRIVPHLGALLRWPRDSVTLTFPNTKKFLT
jgi:hypothetical protein